MKASKVTDVTPKSIRARKDKADTLALEYSVLKESAKESEARCAIIRDELVEVVREHGVKNDNKTELELEHSLLELVERKSAKFDQAAALEVVQRLGLTHCIVESVDANAFEREYLDGHIPAADVQAVMTEKVSEALFVKPRKDD